MYYWSRSAAPSPLDFPFSLLEHTRWASCQVLILSPQEAAKDVLGRMKMVEVEVRFEVATFFCRVRCPCMSITWWFDVTAVLFASFQLESLKRKRTGWVGRVRERSPGWKSCEIFSQLRMLPCFILLFEHGPCKMHEAKFCQSVLNQSLLNEAVSCHNLSQIKNLKSKKSSRKL